MSLYIKSPDKHCKYYLVRIANDGDVIHGTFERADTLRTFLLAMRDYGACKVPDDLLAELDSLEMTA